MDAKARTKLTYADYVCLPDDGQRHEIIGGDHFGTPAPNLDHQRYSRRMQHQLYVQVELAGRGEVFDAPVDLQLSPHDIVQPDLAVVLTSRRSILRQQKIEGAPDLVVEILSKSTRHRDRGPKKRLYERAGVPEYWIVVPEEHIVEQWVLRDGRFVLAGSHADDVTLLSLPDVRVDLTAVWAPA